MELLEVILLMQISAFQEFMVEQEFIKVNLYNQGQLFGDGVDLLVSEELKMLKMRMKLVLIMVVISLDRYIK